MPGFFPSRTLALYMIRLFLTRSMAVLALIIMVLMVLDLLGESDAILAVPGNGQSEILTYVSLRIPQLIARFLPFCILMGTLITLATLNQNSEVISMKAAGLSAHQILAPLFFVCLLIAALFFAFNDRIGSRATATLNRWQAVEYRPIPPHRNLQVNVWVRGGNDLIHVGRVIGQGAQTQLQDVTLFDRHGGILLRELRIPYAVYAGDGRGWRYGSAQMFDVTRGQVSAQGGGRFGASVRADQFTLANVEPDAMTFRALGHAIDDLNLAGRSTDALSAAWWHKISGPLSTVLMPLLGAVSAFGLARSGRLFVRVVVGMMLGFAFFVADNFALAMGNLGSYPPLLAAWGPFFLFLLIGESVLIRTEE